MAGSYGDCNRTGKFGKERRRGGPGNLSLSLFLQHLLDTYSVAVHGTGATSAGQWGLACSHTAHRMRKGGNQQFLCSVTGASKERGSERAVEAWRGAKPTCPPNWSRVSGKVSLRT